MARPIRILYTNHRGETRNREVLPLRVYWSHGDKYHPNPGWRLEALDLENEDRPKKGFNLESIHRIENTGPGTLYPIPDSAKE